jgi:hypothetical protein
VVFWYIFPVLESCAKKNLATLDQSFITYYRSAKYNKIKTETFNISQSTPSSFSQFLLLGFNQSDQIGRISAHWAVVYVFT